MKKTEDLIRNILGACRGSIRTLVCAVEVTEKLLFEEGMAMDDIHVTKDVYPQVSHLVHKKQRSVSRNVERMANKCWDKGDREVLTQIIGRNLKTAPAPNEMLIYLAYYAHKQVPFFVAVGQFPALLFGTGGSNQKRKA